MAPLTVFLIGLGLTVLVMTLTWIFSVKVNNYGIVDAVWSFSFLMHALIFFNLSEGYLLRKLVLLFMIGAWSFRLGYFLTVRISSHHPVEDTRYAKLRADYGDNYKFRFFIFFMTQALSVSILTIPFIFVMGNKVSALSGLEIFGALFWLVALVGESTSDRQMNTFKSNPANKGQVCNIGLWNYSRHPNYFFESCIWFGFFFFCVGTEGLIWSIYAPLIILYLLLKVTGVPPSEAQSLKSRGDLYKKYQATTSMFVPWFRKKGNL